MEAKLEFIPLGGVTSPRGFRAGTTCAGIKTKVKDSLDLGILFSEIPCAAAAVFTTNQIKAAPVVLSRQRLALRFAEDLRAECTSELRSTHHADAADSPSAK